MTIICAIDNIWLFRNIIKLYKGAIMSVYVVNEIMGTSDKSWEDEAKQTIEAAVKTVEGLRILLVKC